MSDKTLDLGPLYVLGASDTEMEQIEDLLIATGRSFALATYQDDVVNVRTAYQADGIRMIHPSHYRLRMLDYVSYDEVIAIECGSPWINELHNPHLRIDHHYPTDPGYSCPPQEFLYGSSMGQLIVHLAKTLSYEAFHTARFAAADFSNQHDIGTLCQIEDHWCVIVGDNQGAKQALVIPSDYIFAAAGDHCPGAAYRGECPGVDPQQLMGWRTLTHAENRNIDYSALLAEINLSVDFLHSQQHNGFVDLVALGIDTIPEGPEAALRANVAILSKVSRKKEGEKLVLLNASPQQIEQWMAEQKTFGRETYGNPHRGYAGAYL